MKKFLLFSCLSVMLYVSSVYVCIAENIDLTGLDGDNKVGDPTPTTVTSGGSVFSHTKARLLGIASGGSDGAAELVNCTINAHHPACNGGLTQQITDDDDDDGDDGETTKAEKLKEIEDDFEKCKNGGGPSYEYCVKQKNKALEEAGLK